MTEMTFKTSIKPELLKKHLISSTIMGAIGMLLLFVGFYFVPPKILPFLGPAIVIAWVILGISWIRPYVRLKKLSLFPDELILRKTALVYKGSLIPLHQIKTIHYIAEGEDYGLKFDLKNGSSLFLPYFTKQSFDELKSVLKSGLNEVVKL
jgi:membrane protein YdbS with pleckstrin-like domain